MEPGPSLGLRRWDTLRLRGLATPTIPGQGGLARERARAFALTLALGCDACETRFSGRLPRPFSPCPSAGAQALGRRRPRYALRRKPNIPALAVLEQLARHHYVRRAIDDSLSSDTLDNYLDALDPRAPYFLEGDIARFERYCYTLDDVLRRGLALAFEIFNRYQATAEPSSSPFFASSKAALRHLTLVR